MATRDGMVMRALRGLFAGTGALAVTLAIFLVLPLLQTISKPPGGDLEVTSVDVALEPPPPPPVEEEQEDEEEPPEQAPELQEEAPPLELSQLELALDPGFGGAGAADFSVDLSNTIGGAQQDAMDEVFSLADLDQQPRPIFQRTPDYPQQARRQGLQGTVYVVFLVDRQGRVVNPRVQKSTNTIFEQPALEAVRQWKFEPGTRKGEAVQFKMRIPITFNAAG